MPATTYTEQEVRLFQDEIGRLKKIVKEQEER